MAQRNTIHAVASLRAITYRISSTPTKELPHIAQQIAASLWNCKDLFSTPLQTTKSQSEIATLIHRFKTSLSTLLQDRTIEGRWAAVVLVKATIEAGGVEVLSKSGVWIRSLLSILKKSDPPSTRNLAIITLTRIFMLTWDYSNLVREITTPNLPTFIISCLNNLESRQRRSTSETQMVLEAFASLIPRHPTIFRTHEPQIRSLLLTVLSSTSSNIGSNLHYTQDHIQAAQRLFTLFHHCAPKQGSADRWNETVRATISSAHETCDRLFRSIIENWCPDSSAHKSAGTSSLSAGKMALEGPDSLGLSLWSGAFAGCERVVILLGILRSHLDTVTADAVILPFGLIVGLLARLLSITPPNSDKAEPMQVNIQISKDEREAMFSTLPDIHAAALGLVNFLLARFETYIMSVLHELLELVVSIYSSAKLYVPTRAAAYETIQRILELIGPSLSKEDIAELGPVIRTCCNDLLPTDAKQSAATSNTSNGSTSKQHAPNGDITHSSANMASRHPTQHNDLRLAAKSLLTIFFTKINPAHLPRKFRAQMERTAILTRHRKALIAAAMSPARKHDGMSTETSLLPLLAGLYPESDEVEAILRPRMPVMSSNNERVIDEAEASVGDEESVINSVNGGERLDLQGDVEHGNKPTDDLLFVLEQNGDPNLGDGEIDEFYAATPRSHIEPEFGQHTAMTGFDAGTADYPSAKRNAVEPPDEPMSAKRLRASPVAEALEPESAGPLPGTDPASIEKSLPVTLAFEGFTAGTESLQQSSQFSTLPKHPADNVYGDSSVDRLEQVIVPTDDNNDSDLEIPPLNMEPDTDPEEEDDIDES